MIRPVVRNVISSVVRGVIAGDDQESRFFTLLVSALSQSYTSDLVSPTAIRMDVYPLSDNTGLPNGAPDVTPLEWQTITFAFSGSISEWGKNGTDFFDGYIANIEPLINGVDQFVGQGWLGGDGTSLIDGALTRVNLSESSTSLFTLSDGRYTGPNISLIDGDFIHNGPLDGFSFYPVATVVSGHEYRLTANVSNYDGSGNLGYATATGIPRSEQVSEDSNIDFTYTTTGGLVELFGNSTNSCTYSNITARLNLNIKQSLQIFLMAGQSLSIGTLNPSVNPKPAQPELDENFMVFNGAGSVGRENTLITDAMTSSLIRYEEGDTVGSGFYTPGTGLLSNVQESRETLFINAGIGGQRIENLDLGGSTNAYVNQQKYLERAKLLDTSGMIRASIFLQGSSDAGNQTQEYYDKLVTYQQNNANAIEAEYPTQGSARFMFYQVGGGRSIRRVQKAQLNFSDDGLGTCIGPVYWLNRGYPNTVDGVDGATSTDRTHLNVSGYRYLGEMIASAYSQEGYKPTQVESLKFLEANQIQLTCHVPFGGTLTSDTGSLNIPEFSGLGIEVEKADNSLVEPLSVSISGNVITSTFAENILPGERVRIGYTATDITINSDAPTGGYPDTVCGTNIRSTVAHASAFGLPDWYDWLSCDTLYINESISGLPVYPFGSEAWSSTTNQEIQPIGQNFRWDGVNLTREIDGSDSVIPTDFQVLGSVRNVDINFSIISGNTYRISGNVNITGPDSIKIIVGSNETLTLTSSNNGLFSSDVVADGDGGLLLRVSSLSIVATLDNVSVKQVV